ETGAKAAAAGASAEFASPPGRAGSSASPRSDRMEGSSRDSGSAKPDAPPNQHKGRKRRKRKRGRKVFARDQAEVVSAVPPPLALAAIAVALEIKPAAAPVSAQAE